MKKCSKCEKTKDLGEFHRQKSSPDGYKPRCKTCRNASNKQYREDNPEYYKEWRDEHKSYMKKYNSKYRSQHKDRLNKERVARANRNPEATKAYKRAWYKANQDKVLERKRRRRERKIACGEVYSSEHQRATFRAFDNKCFNCGSGDNLHIDHHRPLVKGHPLSLDNAVVLCESCNKSKSIKDPEDFYGITRCQELDTKLAQIKVNYLRRYKDVR